MARRLTNQAFHHAGAGQHGLPIPNSTPIASVRNLTRLTQIARWGLSLAGCLGLATAVSPAYSQDSPANSPSPSPPDAAPVETPATSRPTLQMGSQGEAVKQLQAMLLLMGFYTDAVDGVYGSSTAIAVADFQETAGLTPDGIMGTASWSRLLPSLSDMAQSDITQPDRAEAIATESDSTTVQAPDSSPSSVPTPAPNTPDITESPAPSDTPAPVSPAPEDPTSEPAASDVEANEAEPESEPEPEAPPEPSAEAVDLPILRIGMQGPAVERLQERLQALGFYTGAIDGIFGEGTKSAVETAQRNYDIYPDGVVGPVTWTVLLR